MNASPRQHGVATEYQEHVMNPLPAAARVSGAAVVALALSGCYYVGPYPYGYYGAAPYPSPYATTGATPGAPGAAPGAIQGDANGQYAVPAGPGDEAEDADPNANAANGNGVPPPGAQSQQGPQVSPPAGVYAPAPVAVAPAYYPAYPAYYPPPYYGGYGWPGWWGPGVSLNFGFGHYGHYGHYGYHHH
jgi:hypothetical protein